MRISSKCVTDTKSQMRTLNETTEQIEIYQESCVRTLESIFGRITIVFTKFDVFFWNLGMFGVKTE